MDIYVYSAIVVPFTDYELIKQEADRVRYDQYTGKKIVDSYKYYTYKYSNIVFEHSWEMEQKIEANTGLSLFRVGEEYDSPLYIGLGVSSIDAKCPDPPKQFTFEKLESLKKEVQEKIAKVGYAVEEPFLLQFVTLN